MNTIGQSIRAARLAALLSQQELAEKAGIGDSQLSRYENDWSTPSLQIAIFLADALGITLDELVGHNCQNRYDSVNPEVL